MMRNPRMTKLSAQKTPLKKLSLLPHYQLANFLFQRIENRTEKHNVASFNI